MTMRWHSLELSMRPLIADFNEMLLNVVEQRLNLSRATLTRFTSHRLDPIHDEAYHLMVMCHEDLLVCFQ